MQLPSHPTAGMSPASSVFIRSCYHLSNQPFHPGPRDRFRFRPLSRRPPPPACGGGGGRSTDNPGARHGPPVAGSASSGQWATARPAHRSGGKAQQRADDAATADSRDDAATGRLGGLGGRLAHPRAAGLGDARRGRRRHGRRRTALGGTPAQRRSRRLVRRRPVAQRRLQPGRARRRADALACRRGPAHPSGARCQCRFRRTRRRAWQWEGAGPRAGQRPGQRAGRHDAGGRGTAAGGAPIWAAARSTGGEVAARSRGAAAPAGVAGATIALGSSPSRLRPNADHDREGRVTSISGGGL